MWRWHESWVDKSQGSWERNLTSPITSGDLHTQHFMTWLPDSLCGNMKGRAICFPKYIEIYWHSYNLILMFECYLSLQVQTWNQAVMPWMLCQVGRIQFFSCLVAFLVLFFLNPTSTCSLLPQVSIYRIVCVSLCLLPVCLILVRCSKTCSCPLSSQISEFFDTFSLSLFAP